MATLQLAHKNLLLEIPSVDWLVTNFYLLVVCVSIFHTLVKRWLRYLSTTICRPDTNYEDEDDGGLDEESSCCCCHCGAGQEVPNFSHE